MYILQDPLGNMHLLVEVSHQSLYSLVFLLHSFSCNISFWVFRKCRPPACSTVLFPEGCPSLKPYREHYKATTSCQAAMALLLLTAIIIVCLIASIPQRSLGSRLRKELESYQVHGVSSVANIMQHFS
jgi:hypothetical protein